MGSMPPSPGKECMTARQPFSVAPWVLVSLCLGGSAVHAEWLPLRQEIVNASSTRWNVDFDVESSLGLGYTIHPGGVSAPSHLVLCQGKAALPPGASMRFHVVEHKGPGVKARFRMADDRTEGFGTLTVSIHCGVPGERDGFGQGTRVFGSEQKELVAMSDRVIALVDYRDQNLPGSERKSEAPGPEGKGEAPGPAKASLAKLGDGDLEAGVGKSEIYYSVAKIRKVPSIKLNDPEKDCWGILHEQGNLFQSEILADYFFNTVFQYNSWVLMNYKPRVNYDKFPIPGGHPPDPAYARELFTLAMYGGPTVIKAIRKGESPLAFLVYKNSIEKFLDSYCRNPPFILLGAAYMRQKIIIEKIQHALNRLSGEELDAAQKSLYQHDRSGTVLWN